MTTVGRSWPTTEATARPEYGPATVALAALLIGLVFILDSITPRGIPAWILYLIPLLLIHRTSYSVPPLISAFFCAGLTFLAYLLKASLPDVPTWIPLLNRSAGCGLFIIIAYLAVQHRRMTHDLMKAATREVEHQALRMRESLLAKNAEELQDLYDHAPCGYHSLDPDGLIIAMNQTELNWLGYTKQEVFGKKRFSDLLTSAGVQLFQEQFPIFRKEGRVHGLEFDMVRKNGTTFPTLLSATAITDADGRFVASRSTLVDITDRKRADILLRKSHEELETEVRERTEALRLTNERLEQELITTRNTQAALKSTELRFQLMANHAPVLIWISDLSKSCIWFNTPWLEFVGRSLEEEVGNGWAQHVHPDDHDYCLKVYESSFEARREFKMEYRLRRHDGEWRWVLDHGLPRFEGENVFVGFIGSCIDITEHREALAAAQDSEQRLSSIFGSAMDGIITINERQEITHFNTSAETMFGCTAQEAIGRSVTMLIPERFRTKHSHHVAAFGRTSVTKRQMGALGTISGLRTNGEEFPIEASISQVRARGQKLFTVILRDISQRKQAEDALKASEARFRELLECLPQLILTCTPEGACDYLSPQWVAYTGMAAELQLSSGWLEQLHPDDRSMTIERWDAAVGSKAPLDIEFRIRSADGQYRWFRSQATPIHGDDGRVVKWLRTHTDIDDRKRSEEVQARLGAIVESSSDAIIGQGLDGLILTWNLSAEQMFGYLAEEMVGQPIRHIVPPHQRQEEWITFEEVKAGKHHRQHETLRVRKNGTSLYVSLTVSPIKNAEGTVIGISTIARDITAKKRAEETMEQQRKLLELSYEPIFAWDMQNGIVEWNRGCEQLYGFTRSEALGQSSNALLRTVFPFPLDQIHATLESSGEWTGELYQRTKAGHDLLVDSRWGLLKTNGRSLVLETNRDITERRQSEVMILEKNKDLETLLHVTSHDLKEPLRAIESFSVLLQERYANRLDEKGQDFLRRIVRATQRLDQLLTDILDLSRAQRMDPPVTDIDADQLVQEVMRRLERRMKETGAKITIRSPLPNLRVNTTWAIQGIYNLVSNALKFASAGEPPNVEIAPHTMVDLDGTALIGLVVRDRGPGVAPDQRERIFELFRRAVGREIEGTGAGLAIVRQVAERHGGRAWMAPREGGGSDFFITFGVKQPIPSEVSA